MKKTKLKYSITSFFICLFIVQPCFARQAEFEAIRKLEEGESGPPPQKEEVIVRPKIEYEAEDYRDPFRQPALGKTGEEVTVQSAGAQKKSFPSLKIQGIIWGGAFPQAIINNKPVKLGDIVEGALVTAIDKEAVTLFFEGEQYILGSPATGGALSRKPGG